MHIVTGLVIAAFASRMKKNAPLGGLPRFKTGPVRVAHALPGRIRFCVPSLREARAPEPPWVKDFRSLPGVTHAEVSTVTGSVVVTFRPEVIDPPRLFGALVRLAGLEEELERIPPAAIMREIREVGKSLNHAVYDKTGGVLDLWSLCILGLIVAGTRKVAQTGWASVPAGFTLLWWALNSLTRRQENAM